MGGMEVDPIFHALQRSARLAYAKGPAQGMMVVSGNRCGQKYFARTMLTRAER